jgi:hypothetical protein
MLMLFRKRRPAIRTLRGWAVSILQEAGAIRECEEHGWMMVRGDPDARQRAISVARRDPPFGACLRRKRSLRSGTCSDRSATLVRNASPTSYQPTATCFAEVCIVRTWCQSARVWAPIGATTDIFHVVEGKVRRLYTEIVHRGGSSVFNR